MDHGSGRKQGRALGTDGLGRQEQRRLAMLIRLAAASLAIGATAPWLVAQSSARGPCESILYGFVGAEAPPRAGRYKNPMDGTFHTLKDTTLLDAGAIQRVAVWPHRAGGDTVWDVVATLTPSAADIFARATAAHVGQTIVIRIGD